MDLDTLFVLTTGNLGWSYGSSQAAEIQITQEHECEVNFKQCRCDDTWLLKSLGTFQPLGSVPHNAVGIITP